MTLALKALTSAAFAPFGEVIEPPAAGGELFLDRLLGPSRDDTGPCVKLDTHPAKALPFAAPAMERHELSEQLFFPIGPARYVVAAALAGPDGSPDLASLKGFLVEGQIGICYRRGVWHLPITILDEATTFLMMMRAVGDPAVDTSWAMLASPIAVDRQ